MSSLALLPQLQGWRITEAGEADRADLMQFCLDNPDYDLLVAGEVAEPERWAEDFLTELPPEAFHPGPTYKLVVRKPHDASIAAILDVTLGLIDPRVGHIGLFQVAQALHGTGLAPALYGALERWMTARGMEALRLGVLTTNPRGAAFWARQGYKPTRQRATEMGAGRTVLIDVLYKPLLALTLEAYLARVPRDDPAAP
jgi:GNAT superfamily N-acetyltransferase